MSINFLLDSADPKIWDECFKSGIFKGITTNPTLLKQANQPCNIDNLKMLAEKAERLGCKQLHLQVWGEEQEEIIRTGTALSKFSSSHMEVFVKVPITKTGTIAAKELIDKNIPITFTACYKAKQVLIAASLGSHFIAPYLGRINDQGTKGIKEITAMNKILKGVESNCEILVASIRSVKDINRLSSTGLKYFTINPKIAISIFKNKTTENAALVFEDDAKNYQSQNHTLGIY